MSWLPNAASFLAAFQGYQKVRYISRSSGKLSHRQVTERRKNPSKASVEKEKSPVLDASQLQHKDDTQTLPKTSNVHIEKKKYGAIVTRGASESSPLAVILGWNDSKLKHLRKYSGVFEEKGWATICIPTKSFNTFLRTDSKVKTISLYIIDLIKDLTAKKGNPVVLYSFSNGGCAVYFHLIEALTTPAGQQNFNAFNVVGSIFDSCPVKPSLETIQQVQISVTERIRNPVTRWLVWHTLGILIPIRVKNSKILKRIFKDLGNMPSRGPELFLYSKGDNLALYQDIEEHIAYRKSRGVNVFEKRWEDSAHVAHYMKYQEEYIELLENFLEICFKN